MELKLNSTHISIYNALFLIWNECGFDTELSINRNDVMKLSKIGSANTYTNCLKELDKLKILKYKPSHNPLIGSIINLYRFDNSSDTTNDNSSDSSSGATTAKSSSKGCGNSSDTLYKLLNKETIKLLNNKTYSKKINENLQKWLELEKEENNTLLSKIKISDVPELELEYFQIAKAFQDLFIKNLKEKNAPFKNQENAKFKNYVDPIRLMMKNDGITKEQITTVFNFLDSSRCENGNFSWKTNILSTSKLREKFTQLLLKSKTESNKTTVTTVHSNRG